MAKIITVGLIFLIITSPVILFYYFSVLGKVNHPETSSSSSISKSYTSTQSYYNPSAVGNSSSVKIYLDNVPTAFSVGSNGTIFGIFGSGSTYELRTSDNFENWTTVNNNLLPSGYHIFAGKDIAVTKSGVILVSATKSSGNRNFTIFEASFNSGESFSTVLNMSLIAKLDAITRTNVAPGQGFWHGVAETSNGTLFAGLYNPEGLIFRSVDEGHYWTLVFNASSNSDWHNEIHDVEVDPANNFVYASTDDEGGTRANQSLWVSTDFGSSWTLLYDFKAGGSGLPLKVVPLAIGFLNGGNTLVLGIDNQNTSWDYLMRVEPSGQLYKIGILNVTNPALDRFDTWDIYPVSGNNLLLLAYNSASRGLSIALFSLNGSGNLSTIFTIPDDHNPNHPPSAFLSASGPSASGKYGILAQNGGKLFLLVLSYPY